MDTKSIAYGVVIGICVAVTAFQVWAMWGIRAEVLANKQKVDAVITFINSLQQPAPATAEAN